MTFSDEKSGTIMLKKRSYKRVQNKIKDNKVLCQLSVKPKANVSCQLNFRLFVSCQLKFWPFVGCLLTPSRPSTIKHCIPKTRIYHGKKNVTERYIVPLFSSHNVIKCAFLGNLRLSNKSFVLQQVQGNLSSKMLKCQISLMIYYKTYVMYYLW